MIRDSLVAINITQFDKLLNNSTVPILFYWNGEGDIIDAITQNESFMNYIKERCMTINNYTKSKMSYFFFKYDSEDKEQYSENVSNIQDVFAINLNEPFMLEYLITIFKQMHGDFMKAKYDDQTMFNTSDVVVEIYDTIQQKFPNRFIKESVVNYVRSELKKKYLLNDINTNSVIDFLENIIKDKK